MPELVFFRRGEEVLRFNLDRERVVLGRSERCDVVIPDPEVSRQHAAVVQETDGYRLEDLSGKGTLLRGESRTDAPLHDGDDLTLGPWRALFRLRAAPERVAVTAAGGAITEAQRDLPDAGGSVPPAQLRLRQGRRETTHPVGDQPLVLGKDPGCDLILEDRFASARHLKVVRQGNRFQVTDLRTTNGTWLGSSRLLEAELPFHAALRIGETELWFEPVRDEPGRRELCYHGIVGQAGGVRRLADQIERVAPSTAAVTILGESGTGKELVAKALHARSSRSERPLVPVNCAAISRELIESELFGHEKGAFTGALQGRKGAFEEADGGTLFLDEVGELPLELQPKLLRALESGEIKRVGAARPITVDVRIVAATNRDLHAEAQRGRFREDLYYRLCVFPIHLAPLRSRRDDVPALAEALLQKFAPRGQGVSLTHGALERLKAHAWPGNVRELRNVIHRALLLRRGPAIDASDLAFDAELNPDAGVVVPSAAPGLTLEQQLERVERQIVENALRRCEGNRERVARELGVARSTLFKRLKDWGLTQGAVAE